MKLFDNLKRNNILYFVIFLFILIIASYLRSFQIETRPLHNDESVNFLFVEQVNQLSYYPYSHLNYHGPLYFYITTWMVNHIGDSVFGLRSSAILCGILTILILPILLNTQKKTFILIAALLIAFSPSLIFFSRYAIHETLLVLGNLIFGISIYNWHRTRTPKWLYIASLGLTIMITTKETFIIGAFAIFCSLLAIGDYKNVIKDLIRQKQHIFLSIVIGVFSIAFIFTAAFSWHQGLSEFFLAFPQWFARNDSDIGHHKAFEYYFSVINDAEPYLSVIFLLSLAIYCLLFIFKFFNNSALEKFKSFDKFFLFMTIWSLVSFLVYSKVKYKTVWLIINITLPAHLFVAYVLSKGFLSNNKLIKTVTSSALLIIFCFQGRFLTKYNFQQIPIPLTQIPTTQSIPYGPGNPFSYVHTSPGTLSVVNDMIAYLSKKPNAKILIGVDGYFPIPFYMRKWQNQIAYTTDYKIEEAFNYYDILVLDYYKENFTRSNYDKKYYRLSDYKESFTYFKALAEQP